MSRRLPLCATCGGSLRKVKAPADGAVEIVTAMAIPGKPSVGWHIGGSLDCASGDSLAGIFLRRETRPNGLRIVDVLREIDQRGPGRVVVGRAAWRRTLQ